jgi:hypothetical protein
MEHIRLNRRELVIHPFALILARWWSWLRAYPPWYRELVVGNIHLHSCELAIGNMRLACRELGWSNFACSCEHPFGSLGVGVGQNQLVELHDLKT